MIVVLTCALALLAVAGPVEKTYPDGTVQLKYSVDDQGAKEGPYEECYPNGKTKIKATYKADRLEGAYKSFHVNGKPHITAAYKAGKLSGGYVKETEQGLKKLIAAYRDDKLHGTLIHFDKGKPVLTQLYKEGQVLYPRGLDDIKRKLAEIFYIPPKPGANLEVEAAFRRLKAYRYLAEVPYENLELDEEAGKAAQAAASICDKLGRLDHDPQNLGLPEMEYKLALAGAKNSNLAKGQKSLEQALDDWMDDKALAGTAQHLGHRRWCINPEMQKVGFGKSASIFAMWAHDRSQKMVPDYDFVAYPPRGLMPLEFFKPDYYWNVTFHPAKFQVDANSIKAKIYLADALFNKFGEPLRLDYCGVDKGNSGVPNCLIFRPEKGIVAAGRRFLVEIEGLTRMDGKPAGTVSYLVDFVLLR